MKVVGLDLSLTATGFCWPDGRTETLSSKRRGVERIVDLRHQISDNLLVSAPSLVALEDYAFSRGGHAHETGELGGVIKVSVLLPNFAYVLIGPSSLKKFATGKGGANKIAMAVAAAKLGMEFADDNCCDAWWLREMALYAYDERSMASGEPLTCCVTPKTAYRDESVGKITWPAVVA